MKKNLYISKKQGVTMFFAILIIGLLLSIGFSIALLAQKQLSLSTLSTQSELAFYAADAATECSEYWDKNANPNPFDPNGTTNHAIQCINPTAITIAPGLSRSFTVYMSSDTVNGPCASTTVSKIQENGYWVTEIEAHGFNTCNVNSARRLERAIFVTY